MTYEQIAIARVAQKAGVSSGEIEATLEQKFQSLTAEELAPLVEDVARITKLRDDDLPGGALEAKKQLILKTHGSFDLAAQHSSLDVLRLLDQAPGPDPAGLAQFNLVDAPQFRDRRRAQR